VLGVVLYVSLPWSAKSGSIALFVAGVCIILSMYGGGFATAPAYLADLFGTQMVGAIHGRLLTAWSTAGILGPVVVNYMREYQLSLGMPRESVYNTTMYILAGMLVLGLICNLLIRPIAAKHFMTPEELAVEKQLAHEKSSSDKGVALTAAEMDQVGRGGSPIVIGAAWLAVGIPLVWGITLTLEKAAVLFK